MSRYQMSDHQMYNSKASAIKTSEQAAIKNGLALIPVMINRSKAVVHEPTTCGGSSGSDVIIES